MAQVKMSQDLFKVVLTEYDRFSGRKPWDVLYFDNEAEARQYAVDYNKKHNNHLLICLAPI